MTISNAKFIVGEFARQLWFEKPIILVYTKNESNESILSEFTYDLKDDSYAHTMCTDKNQTVFPQQVHGSKLTSVEFGEMCMTQSKKCPDFRLVIDIPCQYEEMNDIFLTKRLDLEEWMRKIGCFLVRFIDKLPENPTDMWYYELRVYAVPGLGTY